MPPQSKANPSWVSLWIHAAFFFFYVFECKSDYFLFEATSKIQSPSKEVLRV